MKTIRRLASVAVGAAMVGSVLSTGLAAAKYQPDETTVTELINNIKANLDDVQVVVGHASAPSDAVGAAQVAAVLASMAYEKAQTVEGGKVLVDVTGTTAGLTEDTYNMYWVDGLKDHSKVITQQVMPGLLSKQQITSTDEDTEVTKTFVIEDSITLDATNSKMGVDYKEDKDAYGYYFGAEPEAIKYTIDFTKGDELVLGHQYDPLIKVNLLGSKYVIDTKKSKSDEIVLYGGEELTLAADSSATIGDFTVTVTAVDQRLDKAWIQVTAPDGTTSTKELLKGQSWTFWPDTDHEFTVYLEGTIFSTSGEGKAMIIAGPGQMKLRNGDYYPLDDRWRVSLDVDISSNVLKSIQLIYRDTHTGISNIDEAIKMGDFIYGPKLANGEYGFKVGLTNWKVADLTSVKFMPGDDIIEVQWEARDGTIESTEGIAKEDLIIQTDTTQSVTLQPEQYTIIGDRLVKYEGRVPVGNEYYAKFTIDGVTRQFKIDSTNNQTTLTWDFPLEDTYGYSQISCDVTVTLNDATFTTYNANTCDFVPDAIPIGNNVIYDAVPYLDLTHIKDSTPYALLKLPKYTDTIPIYNNSGSKIGDATKNYIRISYDNETTQDSETGLYVEIPVNVTDADNDTSTTSDQTVNYKTIVDLSKSDIQERDKFEGILDSSKYWIAEVDGSDESNIVVTQSDEARDWIITLTAPEKQITGQMELGVGDSVNGVTIVGISGVSGEVYNKKFTINPVDLIKLDTEAGTQTYKIVVGGPCVNTLAEQATGLTCDEAKEQWATGDAYLWASNTTLVVAGRVATDTMNAVQELIAKLTA